MEVDDASSWSNEGSEEEKVDPHLAPAEEEASEGEDGFGHHGDPYT